MGLIARIRRRLNIWAWRIRFWWLDTPAGELARRWLVVLGCLVVLVQIIRVSIASLMPLPPDQPAKSWIWVVVQLVIALVAAYMAYANQPKVEDSSAQSGTAPTTEDGQDVLQIFGTVWISDQFVLAWKMMGTDAIRK
ncbi:MAG: hypothetical protein CGU28_03095 [Candidatus Dactylopiibacterium carminicum]|uniref:Uncharacterized protein n=1 Tax=Candidatus Dactylopiibacterium carminicum TaxID=857335 RepID=A0A272EYM9_9RHOO|nr:hypothetical protein [Candidatus Dactylopiibacterium carminicum]KAF7600629.1 hypothetical protein BGI27_01730 [Candidatus Dactylopiibacterium carminicum]PAS95136.1 MAG: hypothetical protein CGU29_01440 [Candidatus Dactylopiibacterium carminicum]PAS97940.1 MAG: hypothetical protein CGU28_03095 [Candidatus Dactylopiibacterium carminicum]PAT00627.1 MAG: hypothetical protein BSR46_01740 [Candidatus Dactylopiibacterium carminicum]